MGVLDGIFRSIDSVLSPVASVINSPEYQSTQSGNVLGANTGGYSAPSTYQTTATGVTQAAAPPPDPYAKWGGKAAYDSLVQGFNTQKDNIYSTQREASDRTSKDLGYSILDYLDKTRVAQKGVENKAINNELARQQGVLGIQDMVGRGIRSGGVMLANKNASNSSAGQALARAYGDIGRRQLANVNNQYELGERGVDEMQDTVNMERRSGERRLRDKDSMIGGIVDQARSALGQLDAARASASLPDRIAIDQEIEYIKRDAINRLAVHDATLDSGLAGIQAGTDEGRRGQAAQLRTAGVTADNPFAYDTEISGGLEGTGPFASNLPLFSFRRRQEV